MSARVSVFEALNHARKEILVGATERPLPEFGDGAGIELPAEFAHWLPSDGIAFRRLSENMPVEDARHFVELYAFCVEQGGWRVVRMPPR